MMINGRLIGMVPKSKRYVAAGVALQWVGLLANMTMILVVCVVLERLYERTSTLNDLIGAAVAMVLAAAVRAGCAMLVTRMGHLASFVKRGRGVRCFWSRIARLPCASPTPSCRLRTGG